MTGTSYLTGQACRLPGAPDVNGFRELLRSRRCSVTAVPEDRWRHDLFLHPDPGTPGKAYTFAAGVLDDIWGFDLSVFNVSPREAAQMDPQQRILLQVVWEALEDARIPPDSLAGTRVGVYVGASTMDHGIMIGRDPSLTDAYMMTGNTLSLIANRISHAFDLRGPSTVVDTACSSGLVALHQAQTALASGDVDVAIVAGVNILLNPGYFAGFSAARMLSPTGLCQAFSDKADGYVRSEGAVAFVLQRASRPPLGAIAEIVDCETNADGHTVNVALPAEEGQYDLLSRLYGRAEVSADDLSFVEAHGTGTLVGDPVEAHALGRALAQSRSAPLPIGSVKSNVGHLEPASGLVGLLKALTALHDRCLPATLHVDGLNPHIDFEALNLTVTRDPLSLADDGVLMAGVSSFGFGGVNSHCILRSVAPVLGEEAEKPAQPDRLFVTSAFCDKALAAQAAHFAPRLAEPETAAPGGLIDQVQSGRSLHPRRLAVLADDAQTAEAALNAAAKGEKHPALVTAQARTCDERALFVYSGNGAQYAGMCKLAMDRDPAYARAIRRIARHFEAEAGWPILEWLQSDTLAEDLESCTIAQALLFADQSAQTTALKSRGIEPAAVLGHSGGEVAAAWASGALTLRDAVRLVIARSSTVSKTAGQGTMAALQTSAAEASEVLAAFAAATGNRGIEIAAVNSPASVSLVGSGEAINAFVPWVRKNRRLACVPLSINYPYHSEMLDPFEDELKAALAGIRPRRARRRFISGAYGQAISGGELDASYWWSNTRQPVQFEAAIRAGADLGFRAFIEIGPTPVLNNYMSTILADLTEPVGVTHSLARTDPVEANPLARAAARAVLHGIAPRPGTLFVPPVGEQVPLPHYPWQNTELRLMGSPSLARGLGVDTGHHSLLGVPLPGNFGVWRRDLDDRILPVLADHRIGEAVWLPATAFAEMIYAAASAVGGETTFVEVFDLDLTAPLVLSGGRGMEVQTRADKATRSVCVESRPRHSEEPFRENARARFRMLSQAPEPKDQVPPEPGGDSTSHRIYFSARGYGLDYGPAFQGLAALRRAEGLRECTLRDGITLGKKSKLHGFDPVALDCLLHALIDYFEHSQFDIESRALVPVRIGELSVYRPNTDLHTARIEIRHHGVQSALADVTAFGRDGGPVLRMGGLRLRATRIKAPINLDTQAFQFAAIPCVAAANVPVLPKERVIKALNDALPAELGEDDTLLLLDAATHEAVWAAFNQAADAKGFYRHRHGEHPAETALLGMIARLDLATQSRQGEDWQIAASCSIPEASALADALREERMDLHADLAVLGQLPAAIAGLLSTTGGDAQKAETHLGREPLTASALGRPPSERLMAAAVRVLLAEAEPGRALRIGVIGRASKFCQKLADLTSRCQLVHLRCNEADRLPDDPEVQSQPIDKASDLDAVAIFEPGALHQVDTRDHLAAALRPGAHLMVLCLAEPALHRAVNALFGADVRPVNTPETTTGFLTDMGMEVGLRHALPDGLGGGEMILAQAPKKIATSYDGSVISWQKAIEAAQAGKDDHLIVEDGFSALILPHSATGKPLGERLLALRDRILALAAAPPDAPVAVILPNGARYSGGPAPDPDQHALWAMLRTASNEYPGLGLRLVDPAALLCATEPGVVAQMLSDLAETGFAETEIVLTSEGPMALRVRRGAASLPATGLVPAADSGVVLKPHPATRLDGLGWHATARPAPGPGEVEVEIKATGLNYRDVMWSMGLLPEEALQDGFAGPTLGFECAGTVTRVGPDVEKLVPGMNVLAVGPACFASHLVSAQEWLRPLPEGLPLEQAAALPVAYFTAHYALLTLGRLGPDDTVLIHGAAGGVGLAAIAVARSVGARVIASAGSPAKQGYLRSLGVSEIVSSRDAGFADSVRKLTAGAGVDVVLNALAGQAMEESLALLNPYGRFLELGKQDFYTNTPIGLRALKDNVAYHGIDVDHVIRHRPKTAHQVFDDVIARLEDGTYPPLPYTRFDGDEVVDAFRVMQRSAHLGKIVVRPPEELSHITPENNETFAPDPEGWHVIAGGLGGLGAETMAWLDARGAGRIALLSRRREAPEDVAARIARLEAHGAEIKLIRCDITKPDRVEAAFQKLRRTAPIASVFHTAAVIEDQLLADLDPDTLARTLAVKTDGLAALDKASRADDLQAFVAFTSLATLVGNPGQAAYVAANAWQEALIQARLSEGLPALAMGLGAISDVGHATRDAALSQMLDKMSGGVRFTSAAALNAMGKLMMRPMPDPNVVVTPMNWGPSLGLLPILDAPSHNVLRRLGEASGGDVSGGNLRADLQSLPRAKAIKRAIGFLRGEIAAILRVEADELDTGRALTEFGMDSLMGVELGMTAQQTLGGDLPQPRLSDDLSIEKLAEIFVRHIQEDGNQSAVAPGAGAVPQGGIVAAHGVRELGTERAAE